ncbi:MAG: TolC family protein, partial [Elusimicrobia bacterium]|nr:TolC family protein [Elusimicrobiota bacterium]
GRLLRSHRTSGASGSRSSVSGAAEQSPGVIRREAPPDLCKGDSATAESGIKIRRSLNFIFSVYLLAASVRAEMISPVVKRIDMAEAVRLAKLNNPSLLESLEDISIAEQRLKMARHLRFPQLGLDAAAAEFSSQRSFFLSEGGSGGLLVSPSDQGRLYLGRATIEQDLYTGRKITNAVALAKAALEKARSVRDKTALVVIRQVQISFVDAVAAKDKEALIVETGELVLKGGVPSSVSPALDMLRWEEIDLEMDRWREEVSSRDRKQSFFALLKAIGMDLGSEVEVVDGLNGLGDLPEKLPTLEQTFSWAREFRPEYRTEALESEMDATQVAIALASRSPVVSLAGMYEYLGPELPLTMTNWSAMLRVHMPLSWDSWATIRERKAQQRRGQVRRVGIDDQISLEVRRAHADFSSKLALWRRYEQHLKLWNSKFAEASAGLPHHERLDLFERYAKARMAAIEAKAAAWRARYEFEFAIGRSLQ